MSVRFEAQAEPIPGYRLIDRLGSGGFGEVWRCEAPGGIFKAVKIIHGDLRSKDNDLVRYAEQELKALKRVKQVRHPYLLALDRYDIIDGRLIIVMELADCNLWDRFHECRDQKLPGIPRDELLQYMLETAEVLDLMNDQFQLQHLDIKPQNLFLLYNHVKVADFGQVKDLQGLMTQVTGGITPVYAAPETFDGIITRYCDQYSLACVYQELLTGVRPFDGCSMSQLLMQHLNWPPNLDPSPPEDRPVLLRALAKKPEDRWPTASAFVRALAGGASTRVGRGTPAVTAAPPVTATTETPPDSSTAAIQGLPASLAAAFSGDEAGDQGIEYFSPIYTPAPPELTGTGPLQPALVIGLGQAGLRVLQRLRFDLAERYGPPNMLPIVRTLYIDTDPDALEDAGRARPAERLAALASEDVFPARLNRAGHYLKPRFNGRTLIEGWFDQQLLYKLPRNPQTLGIRLFGRLAFLDHYRSLMAKIQAEIEAAVAPDALLLTETRTGLQRRTNRPRVYIAASLAGGTGSGMFLDMAFAVRTRLRRLGYNNPDVVGLLVVPPADASLTPPQALGNTFAALTELNHYSRSDTTFTAHYDERHGFVRDTDAPFTRCYLLPGSASGLAPQPGTGVSPPPRRTPTNIPVPGTRPRLSNPGTPKPGSRVVATAAPRTPDPTAAATALKPYAEAAERIRLDLFTPIGRTVEEAQIHRRAEQTDTAPEQPECVGISTFGLAVFDWPRAEVVARTAAIVARKLHHKWAAPDAKRFHEVMPGLAAQRWAQLGLDPETLFTRFQRIADLAVGGKVEELLTLTTEPLLPRGWLQRPPESGQVIVALDKLNRLLGPPVSTVRRAPTPLEDALATTAAEASSSFACDIHGLAPTLVDDPQFRLAGTEELFRQLLVVADKFIERYHQTMTEADNQALAGYETLSQYAHFQKGMRKPTVTELTKALKEYPRARFQSLILRQGVTVYQRVREALVTRLNEVAAVRQRVAAAGATAAEQDRPADEPTPLRQLMPPGCLSVEDAVLRFLSVLTDADLVEIDRRVQSVVDPETGGLLQVCQNLGRGIDAILGIVYEETRAYLDARLGTVELAAMFAERFRTVQQAERAIEQAYQEAEPAWVGNGPWTTAEVTVVACPSGNTGESLRELARRAIPVAGLPFTESRDDLTIYREWPAVPLAALPHLGPAAVTAYEQQMEVFQCPLHARLDVTRWIDIAR